MLGFDVELIGEGGTCESDDKADDFNCWCNIDFVGSMSSGGGRNFGISLLLSLSKPENY